MSFLKNIGVLMISAGLVSCATGPKLDYDGISNNIESGEMAGVISTFKPSGSRVQGLGKDLLLSASLKAKNLDTNKDVTLFFSKSAMVRQIEPGRYKIASGRVRGPNVTGNMPLISLWSEEFEVEGGEVVDLGELDINRIKVNLQTDGVGKAFNAIISLGTDLNDDQTHVTYEIQASSEKDVTTALKKFPDLEDRVVSRPLKMRFTEAEFRDAIYSASERKENGKLPTRFEVQQKLNRYLLEQTLKSASDGG